MNPQTITLGHSPDPDDAFMFYALAKGKIPTHGFHFEHILQDIQTLNERVQRSELDVSAISFHAYPYVATNYALLPCGASMGDGYGPLLISLNPRPLTDLPNLRIAIPGKLTSAFLALRLFLKYAGIRVADSAFHVVPFDSIFNTIHHREADIGLLIHEGQLTYANEGFRSILDLGAWWKEKTGLPLPLGGNVIRKSLGMENMKTISGVLSESIRYGLGHMDEALPHLQAYARGLDDTLTRRFVKMYVNHYTVDCGETGRQAIAEFLKQGAAFGLVPSIPSLEFA